MTQLIIDLPEPLNQQLEARGLSRPQLNKIVAHLLQVYLNTPDLGILGLNGIKIQIKKTNRKAGSAGHLDIVIADDFDEPLDDFAEYMT